jgi:hypothetical protein
MTQAGLSVLQSGMISEGITWHGGVVAVCGDKGQTLHGIGYIL